MEPREPATETAVIVTLPSAEDAVARHRERYDPAAAWGVPAHVTVLYPFVPPAQVDDRVLEVLRSVVASVPRFRATCRRTGWFADDVLWLDPQPADPFRALTTALVEAFPGHLPYGGEYDDVVPHLTVAQDAGPARLREVESDVIRHLPFAVTVSEAELWRGTSAAASWEQVATFPLG